MKYLFYAFFIICINPLLSSGQEDFHYFNKYIGSDTVSLFSFAAEPIEEGYIVTGTFSSPYYSRALYIKKLDKEANSVFTKVFEEGNAIFHGRTGTSLIITQDNNFIVGYTKVKPNSENDGELNVIKFNIEGDIIWHRTYGEVNTSDEQLFILETKDKGLLIGGSQIKDNRLTAYVVKADSLGVEEWKGNYGFGAKFFQANETLDEGYIFGGYHLTGLASLGNTFIVKVDKEGTLLWTRSFGEEDAHEPACYIKVLPDSTYLLARIQTRLALLTRQLCITRLDNNGNTIVEKCHSMIDIKISTTEIYPALDGNFIAGFSYENNGRKPLLAKFNNLGDTIWVKRLEFFNEDATVYLTDLEPTLDKHFIAVGYKYSPSPQRGWIAKIDQDGNTCWTLGCDSTNITTDIQDFGTEQQNNIKVYPNPTTHQLFIKYPCLRNACEAQISIIDLAGKTQFTTKQNFDQTSTNIDISHLSTGTYIVEIVSENVQYQEKIIVIH